MKSYSNGFEKEFINSPRPGDAYMRQCNKLSLVQIMACRLFGAKPLSEPVLTYCQLYLTISSEMSIEGQTFSIYQTFILYQCACITSRGGIQ